MKRFTKEYYDARSCSTERCSIPVIASVTSGRENEVTSPYPLLDYADREWNYARFSARVISTHLNVVLLTYYKIPQSILYMGNFQNNLSRLKFSVYQCLTL